MANIQNTVIEYKEINIKNMPGFEYSKIACVNNVIEFPKYNPNATVKIKVPIHIRTEIILAAPLKTEYFADKKETTNRVLVSTFLDWKGSRFTDKESPWFILPWEPGGKFGETAILPVRKGIFRNPEKAVKENYKISIINKFIPPQYYNQSGEEAILGHIKVCKIIAKNF